MKICDIVLLVVLLIWEIVFIMTADLEITRRKGRDSFKIRSSLCSEKFSCKRFNARGKSNGTCFCPKNYSTFVFHNKTWGCQENEKVRTLLGGDTKRHIYFRSEVKGAKLRALNIKDIKKLKLNTTMHNNCTQDGRTRYFKCSGGEDVSPESSSFELIAKTSGYFIKVNNKTSKDSLKGTIIRLKIICNDTSGGSTTSGVVLFKFKGSINCTIQTPTSTTLPKASKFTMVSKARPNVSEAPSTTLEKRSTTTNPPSKSTVVARPDPNQERRSGGKSSPFLIAGVTVAILVVLILIALLIYRHRNSLGKSNSGRKSKEKRKTVTGSLDEVRSDGPKNEDHYRTLTLGEPSVYESVPVRNGEAHQGNSRKNNDDEGHLYAPLNISGGKNIYGHRNSQETVAKDTRPNINGPISVNQCVYDLMEEILMEPLKGLTEGDENGTEPVYNVLEGSCLNGSQRPAFFVITSDSTEDLVYNYVNDGNHPMGNVLEGPSLNGAEESSHYAATGPMEPVYNTLEANVNDNDGDPVYNVLEATEDEGGPRHQSAMFTVELIHPNFLKSKPNTSERENDLNITTEPVYDTLEQDPI